MESVLDTLVKEIAVKLALQQKAGVASGTPSSPYYTGPGGIFGVEGLNRDIISTRIHPRGIAGAIPARGTMVNNPLFGYLTGYDTTTGSNPTGVCDDPKTAGPAKACIQTISFGRYSFATRELEINRLGLQQDRGQFMDLRLMNDPLLQPISQMMVPSSVPNGADFGREVLQRFIEVGVAFQNQLVRQVYQGNPANNTSGGGYQEFPGLDKLIRTGVTDAITKTACPGLDSDIKNFNYANVSVPSANPGADIVMTLTYLMRMLNYNADRMNLAPVQFAIAMRQTLFWEITAIWPCSYLTTGCSFRATNGTIVENVNATDQVEMRDAMRAGNYLMIDGKQYPVIIDDGIAEETATTQNRVSNGCFASGIYILPMTIMGGPPSLYWEYLDYSDGAQQGISDGNLGAYYWTDGGIFLWHPMTPTNWCVRWEAKTEPRLCLLTPQLAGRVTNVQYCPLQKERSPFPDDPYFAAGGVGGRNGPSLFSDWNTPTGGQVPTVV